MLTTGLIAIDATILATAVPSVVKDLGEFDQFPWRFWLADEPTVSDFRASGRRPAPRDRDVRVRRQVRQTRPDTASATRPHDEEDLRE